MTIMKTKAFCSFGSSLLLLVSLLLLMVYANTLKNGFVLDDVVVVSDNTIVAKGISAKFPS